MGPPGRRRRRRDVPKVRDDVHVQRLPPAPVQVRGQRLRGDHGGLPLALPRPPARVRARRGRARDAAARRPRTAARTSTRTRRAARASSRAT
jgi:hypothetical protein